MKLGINPVLLGDIFPVDRIFRTQPSCRDRAGHRDIVRIAFALHDRVEPVLEESDGAQHIDAGRYARGVEAFKHGTKPFGGRTVRFGIPDRMVVLREEQHTVECVRMLFA